MVKKAMVWLTACAVAMAVTGNFRPAGAQSEPVVWSGAAAADFAAGGGTAAAPYLIENGEQLALLAQRVNAGTAYSGVYFTLTADVTLNDLSQVENWKAAPPQNAWVPIGTSNDDSKKFLGHFDGAGHIVRGIYVNNAATQDSGLFGYIGGGSVKNLRVENSYIKGNVIITDKTVRAGGIAGYVANATVENCYSEAAVYATDSELGKLSHVVAGGIAAYTSSATIKNCVNTGSVTSRRASSLGYHATAAGIVGVPLYGGTVEGCYNTGAMETISGSISYVAGIVGRDAYGNVTVKDCYSTGALTVTSPTATVYKAGIFANVSGAATPVNCYYLEGTADYLYAGSNRSAAGAMTAGQMKSAAFIDTLNSAAAYTAPTRGINGGYPILAWQGEIPVYVVSYDANGGTGGPPEKAYYSGESVKVDFTQPPQYDYDFLGWSAEQATQTPGYSAAGHGRLLIGSDVNLYAVWDIDELQYAILNGLLAEYLAEKKPVIDELNRAAAAGGKADLTAFFTVDGSLSLFRIRSIDPTAIVALYREDVSKFDEFTDRVSTYAPFACARAEDIYTLKNTLANELAVGNMNHLTTTAAAQVVIDAGNGVFGLAVGNAYYLAEKNAVLTALLNREFENLKDLRDSFTQSYVMINFALTDSFSYIGKLVADCPGEIGYDAGRFESIADKNDLYRQLLKKKSAITTLALLRQAIDQYTPDKTDPPTGGSAPSPAKPKESASKGATVSMPPVLNTADPDRATVVEKTALYPDVPVTHWAYEATRYLTAKKVVNGYENGEFMLNNAITRAEFVKILLLGFEIEVKEGEPAQEEAVFHDVAPSDWYYDYVRAAKGQQILFGDEAQNCNPGGLVTRQEMAVLVHRTLSAQGRELPKSAEAVSFADHTQIADWAFSAVAKLQLAGVVSGDGSGSFLPLSSATRAEAAQMIYKAFARTSAMAEEVR